MENHAEEIVYIFSCQLAYRDAVDFDAAAVDIIEFHEQIDHRRFSGARRSDDSDLLAGINVFGKVMNDDFVFVVAEAYMLKFDLSAHIFESCRFIRFVRHFLGFEEFKYAVGGGGSGLQTCHSLCDLGKRA